MIDLSTCKKGDILISKHGWKLTYVEELTKDHFYDHKVEYHDGTFGTRINDGHVYKNANKRLDSDHDIIKIERI